jgi:hypothetical protein
VESIFALKDYYYEIFANPEKSSRTLPVSGFAKNSLIEKFLSLASVLILSDKY